MSDWVTLLGNEIKPMFAVVTCEYCSRKRRYDVTIDFYCRGCGAPLPNTPEFQSKEEQKIKIYFANGGASLPHGFWD